jgi:hypothetical protein
MYKRWGPFNLFPALADQLARRGMGSAQAKGVTSPMVAQYYCEPGKGQVVQAMLRTG